MEYQASGLIVGNGAAINMSLGWYPDWVQVTNLTDGDVFTANSLSRLAFAFTSGGTTEIVAGNLCTGATSGSQFYVSAVLLSSGTWAGGDAAGFFITEEQTGTIASENIYVPGRYAGSATVGKGFTIGSVIATEAKLLHWIALRGSAHMYGQ
jgi:hypothetical protein